MPKAFYAVLTFPEDKYDLSATESTILNALRAKENENILFFISQEKALKYCEIASKPKYLYNSKAIEEAYKTDEFTLDEDEEEPTPEKKDQLFSRFYQSLSDPFLLSHQSQKAFAIIEVELDVDNLTKDSWLLFEETHFVFSYRLDTLIQESENKHLVTLTNKPFSDSEDLDFHIECRKGQRLKILSLRKAVIYPLNINIPFSPPYQKLTLLRDYVLNPDQDKLAILREIISPDESHGLFKLLIKEKLDTQQLLTAKDALFSAYLVKKFPVANKAPQPSESEHAPSTTEHSLSLGWIVAFGCTFGLAGIGYLTIQYLQNRYQKELHRSWKIAICCTLGLAAIGYVLKHPNQKLKTDEPTIKKPKTHKKTPSGIVQTEFNFNEVQQGMYKFWKEQATRADKINHRSTSDKARDYQSTDSYREHLQGKQKRSLSLNHRGELRKKIEFKDKETVLVTGTIQQVKRWSLYADYGKAKSKMTHESLEKSLDKSWSKSSEASKMKKCF